MMKEGDFIHRDISWCDFNARVLDEAQDTSVPLLDRIKFLAIFSSNLDEFFRVKVAALRKLEVLKKKKASKWLGYTPSELLASIYNTVGLQQERFGTTWRNEVLPMLEAQGIHVYQTDKILPAHLQEVKSYFRVHVQGFLNLAIAKKVEEVTLKNREIYLVVPMVKRGSKLQVLGFVNIPGSQVDRFKRLKSIEDTSYYIMIDDVIRINLPLLFSDYEIQGEAYSIKQNRDEDYEIEDEFSGNLVEKIKEKINKRMDGDPVRFLYDADMPADLAEIVQRCCHVSDSGRIRGGRYHNLNDLFQLTALLEYQLPGQKLSQLDHSALTAAESVLNAMEAKDYLLHLPYHRYDSVLRYFNEAAVDPSVMEIKVTLYRISKKSHIAQSLISAAQNGKKVLVFVEVKARYDELNNLQWAREMEKAGITIIYSIPGLKVHAKVALVTKRKTNGRKVRYAYMGTGNFNEKTASLYADHGLFTTDKALTMELESLFEFLKTKSRSIKFNHLLVAGFNMKKRLIAMIDDEIEAAKKGKKAFIVVKVNGLDEHDMIEKLYEASQPGVKVQLIVRAGCSLIPERKGLSDNITAHRLVDMYLEHARVYWFCHGGDEKVFLSSADWMNRNLNRRIEVGFPILDEGLKNEIINIVNLQLADQVKLTSLSTGKRLPAKNGSGATRAQMAIHQWLKEKESAGQEAIRN